MIISFVGHRFLCNYNELSRQLYECIISNMPSNEHVAFFYGGYGAFDKLCLSLCHKIKKKKDDCEITYITPYITEAQQRNIHQEMEDNLYDSVIYPPLENTPPKFAIIKRNEWMIDNSDLIIAYVKNTYGGAYNSLQYAQRKKKKIINLADKFN